jgi:cytoskeletal protein RodZ
LPPPELNPLLNPLLAQNMGRWAQVYFTSPPEKRDQAVQELVRELEEQNSKASERPVAPRAFSQETDREVRSAAPPAEVQPTLIRCHACGRKNLTTQKFCGMCGTRLGEEAAAAAVFDDRSAAAADPPAESREDYVDSAARNREEYFDRRESRDNEVPASRLNRNELSLFQGSADREYQGREYYDDEDPIFSTPPSSGSSGILVGLLLVIAIGVAGYFAWPRLKATLETFRAQPPASSASANANPATPPAATSVDSPGTPPAENRPTGSSRAPAKPMVNATNKEADDSTPSLPHGVSRPPKTLPPATPRTGGGEELAIAQGDLNGTNGRSHNGAEAAQWLWKAVAKHNPDASLLLADLYLKGDGVSKNCDQARVLLDSAALQGVKSAGERLRHLQAFGCQ